MARITNFKLGKRIIDPHHRRAWWPQRSKVKVIMSLLVCPQLDK